MAAEKTLTTLHLFGCVEAGYRGNCFCAYRTDMPKILLIAFTGDRFSEDLEKIPPEMIFKKGADARAYLKEAIYRGVPDFFERVALVRDACIDDLERIFGGISTTSG
jgi:hypothetical protein